MANMLRQVTRTMPCVLFVLRLFKKFGRPSRQKLTKSVSGMNGEAISSDVVYMLNYDPDVQNTHRKNDPPLVSSEPTINWAIIHEIEITCKYNSW